MRIKDESNLISAEIRRNEMSASRISNGRPLIHRTIGHWKTSVCSVVEFVGRRNSRVMKHNVSDLKITKIKGRRADMQATFEIACLSRYGS